MISEFTIDQLIELLKQPSQLGAMATKELITKLTPQTAPTKIEKITSAGFFNTEYSKYADDCRVTVPEGWHIIKSGVEIKWTDSQMIQFAEHASRTSHPDKSFDFKDWEKEHR